MQNGVGACAVCLAAFESGLLWVDAHKQDEKWSFTLRTADPNSHKLDASVRKLEGKALHVPDDVRKRDSMPLPEHWIWRARWAELKRGVAFDRANKPIAEAFEKLTLFDDLL